MSLSLFNRDPLLKEFFNVNHPFRPLTQALPLEEAPSMAIDLVEKDTYYCFAVELPGVLKEDINLNVEENVLNIQCDKKECCKETTPKTDTTTSEKETKKPEVNYLRRERCFGPMSRSMRLPTNIDTSNPTCCFENGVLRVKFQKVASTGLKKLQIA